MKKFLGARPIILIVILALAAILRFWNLGGVPPSASLDEASIGYNAYSVLKTGGDEYGEFPIISQRGYDDWRRSIYLFLVVPFVALFGLNAAAVRLPAVILSILTVWATYRIVLLLFSKRSEFSSNVAFLASFLLAISPWHIYISRLGHESNACLSFLVFGALLFLKGVNQKSFSKVLLSMVFFTLSMISYYSGQAFIPLFAAGLFFIFRKNLLSIITSDKKVLIPFFAFLILLVPIFWTIFSPQALVRFQGTSTFKPEVHSKEFARRVELRNKAVEKNDIVGTILYNRRLFPAQVFIEGYIAHFKPQWLFTNSSGEPFKVPNMGLLYLWEIPFIVIGIAALLFSRVLDRQAKKLIFLWFFLAPLPAAIATQAPHAMRSYNFLPTWQIFTAFGLAYLFYKLPKFKILTFSAFALFILVSLAAFYKNYFIVFPKEQSSSFQYALSKTIPYVLSQQKNYQKVVISNSDNLYQSYMFYLFYSKYDPKLYQKQGGTISGGYAENHKFDNLFFEPINFKEDSGSKGTLYVGNPNEFSKNISPIKTFRNLNGEEAIIVVAK